jgi:hypothetical protein
MSLNPPQRRVSPLMTTAMEHSNNVLQVKTKTQQEGVTYPCNPYTATTMSLVPGRDLAMLLVGTSQSQLLICKLQDY